MKLLVNCDTCAVTVPLTERFFITVTSGLQPYPCLRSFVKLVTFICALIRQGAQKYGSRKTERRVEMAVPPQQCELSSV